jgi:hypothetical protein
VLAGLDTLYNVKYAWSIEDLYDAIDALDIKDEFEAAVIAQGKR